MIRNIQKLSGTALVADAFILIGLLYIFGNEAAVIAHRGVADVVMFNPKDWALLVGCVIVMIRSVKRKSIALILLTEPPSFHSKASV